MIISRILFYIYFFFIYFHVVNVWTLFFLLLKCAHLNINYEYLCKMEDLHREIVCFAIGTFASKSLCLNESKIWVS